MSKFYPLDPRKRSKYQSDPNFTGYNNVAYVGDSLDKYSVRATTLSNEDIFINLNQYNPIESTREIPCAYSEARTTSILPYKADAYKLCVNSVYLPVTSLYLFEWSDTAQNSEDPPVTYDKYTVTVRYYDGVNPATSHTEPLQFTPYVVNDTQLSQIKRVYEINQVIISINEAYQRAFTALGIGSGVANPPIWVEDKNTSLIGIYIDERCNPITSANGSVANPFNWVDTLGQVNIQLGYNYWVSAFFTSSLPSVIIDDNIDDQQMALLRFYNNRDPALLTTISGQPYYTLWQSSSTTDLFSTIEKIVITSSIQTRPQYTSITAVSSITNIVPNSMQSINILLDFPLTLSAFNNGEELAPLTYTPLMHMWQDITTQDSLTLLNYRIFVQRTNGVLTPVFLSPGQMCSVKLLFRLK